LEGRRISPGRLRTVPLGLDLDAFAAVAPLDGATPPVVTAVARLVPVKDLPLLMAAVTEARRRLPALELRIAGDGPLRPALERAAPPFVRFLGNQGDVARLLSDTGVVALSSKSEGSPVALIEALAAARPVV